MSRRRSRQKPPEDYARALDALAGGKAPAGETREAKAKPSTRERPAPQPAPQDEPSPRDAAALEAKAHSSGKAPRRPKAPRPSAPPTPGDEPASPPEPPIADDSPSSPGGSGARPAITKPSRQRQRQSVHSRPRAITPRIHDPGPAPMPAAAVRGATRRGRSHPGAHVRLARTTIPVCLMLAILLPLLAVGWLMLPPTSPLAAAPVWTPWVLIALGGFAAFFAVMLMRQVAGDSREKPTAEG